MPQMWASTKIALALGALLQSNAARVKRQATSTILIKGVPVHNYDRRYEQLRNSVSYFSSKEELDWVVMFKKAKSDGKRMAAFCGHACKFNSFHRFVTFRGDEDMLEKHLSDFVDEVEYVEPDLPVDVVPEVPEMSKSDGPAVKNGNYFHPIIGMTADAPTGQDVNVYVMDTGVRTTHQEFEGRAIPTLDTIAGSGSPIECRGDVNCGYDTHGHGTHCAGSVGGKTWGVAKKSTLHAMRVCCGAGSNIFAGLDWIAENRVGPSIITMSLGFQGVSYAARDLVDAVVGSGVSVFVAAGNSAIDTCGFTYGWIPSTITVGATDQNDARTWWSNYGSCNDIYAPGLYIISAGHMDDTSDKVMSGTSMACPLTAGAGAGLLGLNPSWTPEELKAALLGKAAPGVVSNLESGDPNLRLQL